VASPIERGLPINVEAERYALGSILLDGTVYPQVAAKLEADDFGLEKHRRIFKRMGELRDAGRAIDRVTVAEALIQRGELESVGGVGYLVDLDTGIPHNPNLEEYIRIVKDKSLLRRIVFNAQHALNRAMVAQESADEVLMAYRESVFGLGTGDQNAGVRDALQIAEQYPGGINVLLDPSKREQGLHTGFFKFDDMTCGLHAGELIILAGRPGMGKSALAADIARHVTLHKKKGAVIFSLEMSKESLLERLLCSTARVDSQRYRAGYLNADERKKINTALGLITGAPLYIDDSAAVRVVDLDAKLERLVYEKGVALAIIDYLQLMAGRGENRVQEVTGISRGLKLLAKKFKIPIVALSQLSRAVEQRKGTDHRPQLSDLRDSGSIEQDADLVGFVFRPEVYDQTRDDLKNVAELIIAKQRSGPVGTVRLVFLHQQVRFESRAEDMGDLLE